jgi:hypothetical protein
MSILNTLSFLLNHPLSQGRKLATLRRFVAWQIGARLVPGPVACPFANGSSLLVRPGMTGATGNLYVGLHEFADMAFVLHVLRGGDLFVDVGANIGSYTVLAAAGAGAACLAFEPGSAAFAWLERNVRLNGSGQRYGYDDAAIRRQLLAGGFEECVYQPFTRQLIERRADDAPSANALFIRDRAFIATRLQDAPPIEVNGWRI